MLKKKIGWMTLLFLFYANGAAAFSYAKFDVTWDLDLPYMRFTINSAASEDTSTKFNCTILRPCKLFMYAQPGMTQVWSHTFSNIIGFSFTLKTFLAAVNKQLPISSGFIGYKDGSCLDIGYDLISKIASTCEGTITPPEVVPPVVTCALQNDISLQHGELAVASVNGNTATGYSMLTCTGAASAKVRAIDGGGSSMLKLAADGSLYSFLKVNNIDGSTGVNVSVSGPSVSVPVIFSSTLATNGGVSSGSFRASALAIVSVN